MAENPQQPRRRGIGRPFEKGNSANPGGRPAVIKDIQALARQHTPEAMRALVEALADPKQKVAAAVAILDRGYGRPSQDHNVNITVPASSATDADLATIALAGSVIAAAQADDTPGPDGLVH